MIEERDFQIGDRILHRRFGGGVISGRRVEDSRIIWEIAFDDGETRSCTDLAAQATEREPSAAAALPNDANLKRAVREALDDLLGITPIPLGNRWLGGEIVLVPGREGVREKRYPIDAFFHKIVMVRDRLRVLEQQINSHPKLTDEDRIHMQQYITRIYGSLTTFNALFRNREDNFTGEKDAGADET